MRVLLTADPMLPVPPKLYGGIERVIADLAGWLRGQGVQVGLVAHRDSTQAADASFAWPGAGHALALWRAAREFRPDVVHSFSRLAYLLPVVLAGTPAIMSYQRHPTPWTVRGAALLGGRRLRFTGCSRFITQLGGRSGGRWSAIPNAVDLARYRFVPAVAPDAPLLFLSRLDRVKAPHLAIAMARAAGRRLIVAGNSAAHGPEAEYFRSQVEPHFGRDGVEYVGPVDDAAKARLLGAAAALLVPVQWDEPFGIVFAEALACGTPVIATARGALPEIVEDGRHGFLVDGIEGGARAIGRLGGIDRRACRHRAEALFSLDVVGRQYLELYRAGAGA
jgi:glycosyltransferase involved in cell wall biosynthesis